MKKIIVWIVIGILYLIPVYANIVPRTMDGSFISCGVGTCNQKLYDLNGWPIDSFTLQYVNDVPYATYETNNFAGAIIRNNRRISTLTTINPKNYEYNVRTAQRNMYISHGITPDDIDEYVRENPQFDPSRPAHVNTIIAGIIEPRIITGLEKLSRVESENIPTDVISIFSSNLGYGSRSHIKEDGSIEISNPAGITSKITYEEDKGFIVTETFDENKLSSRTLRNAGFTLNEFSGTWTRGDVTVKFEMRNGQMIENVEEIQIDGQTMLGNTRLLSFSPTELDVDEGSSTPGPKSPSTTTGDSSPVSLGLSSGSSSKQVGVVEPFDVSEMNHVSGYGDPENWNSYEDEDGNLHLIKGNRHLVYEYIGTNNNDQKHYLARDGDRILADGSSVNIHGMPDGGVSSTFVGKVTNIDKSKLHGPLSSFIPSVHAASENTELYTYTQIRPGLYKASDGEYFDENGNELNPGWVKGTDSENKYYTDNNQPTNDVSQARPSANKQYFSEISLQSQNSNPDYPRVRQWARDNGFDELASASDQDLVKVHYQLHIFDENTLKRLSESAIKDIASYNEAVKNLENDLKKELDEIGISMDVDVFNFDDAMNALNQHKKLSTTYATNIDRLKYHKGVWYSGSVEISFTNGGASYNYIPVGDNIKLYPNGNVEFTSTNDGTTTSSGQLSVNALGALGITKFSEITAGNNQITITDGETKKTLDNTNGLLSRETSTGNHEYATSAGQYMTSTTIGEGENARTNFNIYENNGWTKTRPTYVIEGITDRGTAATDLNTGVDTLNENVNIYGGYIHDYNNKGIIIRTRLAGINRPYRHCSEEVCTTLGVEGGVSQEHADNLNKYNTRQTFTSLRDNLNTAAGFSGYSSLFLDDSSLGRWKDSVYQSMGRYFGIDNWASLLCDSKIDNINGGGTAMVNNGNFIEAGSHIEGDKYQPISYQYYNTTINQTVTVNKRLYRLSMYIKNPSDYDDISINVMVTGESDKKYLYSGFIKLGPGRTHDHSGENMIVEYSNKDFNQICFVIKGEYRLHDGDTLSSPFCNLINDKSDETPTSYTETYQAGVSVSESSDVEYVGLE